MMHSPPLEYRSRWADADADVARLLPSEEAGTGALSSRDRAASRPGPWSLSALVSWCGLVAGLLEVGVTVLRKRTFDLESSLPDEPSFRLAGPADRSGDLPRPGRAGIGPGLVAAARSLAGAAAALRVDPASAHLGGLSADLRSGRARCWPWVPRRGWSRRSSGVPPASGGWSGSAFPSSPAVVSLLAASLWGRDRIKEWREAATATAAAGQSQRALDRDGHGGRGPSGPLRLRPPHQPDDR